MNGEIFESENKDSLFSAYSGEAKERLTYPQAARWLVFLNNYDDTAAKKKAKDRTLPVLSRKFRLDSAKTTDVYLD